MLAGWFTDYRDGVFGTSTKTVQSWSSRYRRTIGMLWGQREPILRGGLWSCSTGTILRWIWTNDDNRRRGRLNVRSGFLGWVWNRSDWGWGWFGLRGGGIVRCKIVRVRWRLGRWGRGDRLRWCWVNVMFGIFGVFLWGFLGTLPSELWRGSENSRIIQTEIERTYKRLFEALHSAAATCSTSHIGVTTSLSSCNHGWYVLCICFPKYLPSLFKAIYAVYTSPSHPPIPSHLPTLIVTPHGYLFLFKKKVVLTQSR